MLPVSKNEWLLVGVSEQRKKRLLDPICPKRLIKRIVDKAEGLENVSCE